MRILILLLLPFTLLAQLPSSGSLSIKSAAGVGRSISQQVVGNETGSKSLTTLSTTASKIAPHSILEFYGYPSGPPIPGTITGCTSSLSTLPGGGVNISWSNPASGGTPESTTIEVSTNGGAYSSLTSVAYPSTSYNHPSDFTDAARTYTYRLSSTNATGSGPTCTTTILNFPARPTTLSAPTSSNHHPGGIEFSWSYPGGAAINGYELSSFLNGGAEVFNGDVGNVLSYTVPDSYYTAGNVYNGSIQSYNANNYSLPSSIGGTVTYTAMTSPTSVTASISGAAISVAWSGASGTITNYRIEVSINGGGYSFLADDGATPYSHSSPSAGTTYQYRVRAENSWGSASYTTSNSLVYCSGVPNTPTAASASVVSDDATVNWTLDSFGQTASLGVRVERNAQSDPGTWTVVANNLTGTTSYVDNNLPSDQYIYRVSAQNYCGNSTSLQTNTVIVP